VDTGEFRTLVKLDEDHWWFRGRRRIIQAQLTRLGLRGDLDVLDAGCGSGRWMDDLRGYGRVAGFDLNESGVAHARARGHEDVRVSRIEDMPWADGSFDLITCLDVLEHTPDDVVSMRELWRVARPGATLLATVPAYQSLWSSHDDHNHHFRRYRRRGLLSAAREGGWEPVTSTYFNSFLLPSAAVVRLGERLRPRPVERSHVEMTSGRMHRVLELPLRLEAAAIRRGVRFPAGLSLMAVFRRGNSPQSPREEAVNGRVVGAPASAPTSTLRPG
jgi:SAM-dependent methyltransferase